MPISLTLPTPSPAMSVPPYPYPTTNTELIAAHALIKHFEGGYFAQTLALESAVPTTPSPANPHVPKSAALGGREQYDSGPGAELLSGKTAPRPEDGQDVKTDATQIYYLLTPDSHRGKMHMNLHSTFHIHHAGRALYTLIRPPSPSEPGAGPLVKKVVVGPNVWRGEVKQLFVPGGWWKASEIPEEDLELVKSKGAEDGDVKERVGCLISEVVVPGWNPDQHQFIDEQKLKAMWEGKDGWEEYAKYIRAPDGLEYPEK